MDVTEEASPASFQSLCLQLGQVSIPNMKTDADRTLENLSMYDTVDGLSRCLNLSTPCMCHRATGIMLLLFCIIMDGGENILFCVLMVHFVNKSKPLQSLLPVLL